MGTEAGVARVNAKSAFFVLSLYVPAAASSVRWGRWYPPHRGVVKVRNNTRKVHIARDHLNKGKS